MWIGFSPVVLKFYDSYTQYLFPLEIRYLIASQVQACPWLRMKRLALQTNFIWDSREELYFFLKKERGETEGMVEEDEDWHEFPGVDVDVMQLSQA